MIFNLFLAWHGLNCSHNISFMGLFFPSARLAASYLLRACVLVFNSILWIKPEGWRDLPCLTALAHRRRLHRSIKFWEVLPRFTLQCKQKCYGRNDKKTYRYVCFPCVKNQCHLLITWALCGLPHQEIVCKKACLLSVSLSAATLHSFTAFNSDSGDPSSLGELLSWVSPYLAPSTLGSPSVNMC